ncbi:MAG: DoxX family protein [Mycobacteriaceae bacterium]|nr:DoxX family protein [Mycobacteriaceae bacterium]
MHPHDSRTWQRPASARLVDPEDDLPSATYGGDYETTRIPHSDAGDPMSTPTGLELLADPEPLPYVDPAISGRHAPVAPDTDTREPVDERVAAAGKRGTQDLGLLLLRGAVGALLVAHGLQKAFGLWGGQGLDSLRNSLSDIGYQHADVLTYVAAGTEMAAGVLLVLGLFTPLAAAAALAYLINGLAATVAGGHDVGNVGFFLRDNVECQVLLTVAVMAIILVGPGRYGFDASRGWARRPFLGSFAALLLGIGVGVGAWMLLNGSNPLG